MLHTKFHCNPLAGSGEEDFLQNVTIYDRGSHLGHVTQILRTNFRPMEASHDIWLQAAQWFKVNLFVNVDDDGCLVIL